jgi:hypothetical protein
VRVARETTEVPSLLLGFPLAALLATQVLGGTASGAQISPTVVRDTLSLGERRVSGTDTIRGPLVVAGGDLHVAGRVEGTAVTVLGDIVVEPGGSIAGDAVAILGHVRAPEGAIAGSARAFDLGNLGWRLGAVREATPQRASTASALRVALGWLLVTLAVGIAVLVLAGSYLEGVSDVVIAGFWRSFLTGLLAEVALLPAMAVMVVLLAVTIVGILLIPFALVAYIVAALGLLALGFLAVARVTGAAFASARVQLLSPRGQALRGVVVGVAFYVGLWVLAAAFQRLAPVSLLLKVLAGALTYVAITTGFGAALLSRAGTRRDVRKALAAAQPLQSWQTPTPVTGVVAARRPTASGRS